MSQTAILDLPRELFDAVVDGIDDRVDVLSLALTCRHAHSSLVPDVVDFREISAPVGYHVLWDHLASHPELARHVRVLRIGAGEPQLPRGFAGPWTPNMIRSPGGHWKLCQAVQWMSGLTYFQWGRFDIAPLCREEVWVALKKSCARLTHLEIHDIASPFDNSFDGWSEVSLSEVKSQAKLFELGSPEITSFRLLTAGYEYATFLPNVDGLKRFLLQCPNLTTLELSYVLPDDAHVPFDDILTDANWPDLQELGLSYLSSTPQATKTFFDRHTSIEVLYARNAPAAPLAMNNIQKGALPHLRMFGGSLEAIIQLASAGCPLESIKDFDIGSFYLGPADFRQSLANALQRLRPTLRLIQLGSFSGFPTSNVARWLHSVVPEARIELWNGGYWVEGQGFVRR